MASGRWKRNQSRTDGTETKEKCKKPTTFGTVKVDGAVLGQRSDVKTFVVTNKTSIKELLLMVLNGFSAIYEDSQLFYLCIESLSSKTDDKPKNVISLRDVDKALEMQSRYPPASYRFVLHVKPETGILTVRDKAIKPERPSCSVFVKESATCLLLVQLMLDTYKVKATPDQYVIYEVDSASEVTHELKLCNRPLTIQNQWLEPHLCYFEVRQKADPKGNDHIIRRAHSLEEIRGSGKLMNIQEIRKSFIGHHAPCLNGKSTNQVAKPRDANLTKIRESLKVQITSAKTSECRHLRSDSGKSTPDSRPNNKDIPVRRSHSTSQSSEVSVRRARSLSRDTSSEIHGKSTSGFGHHTLERARQRQRRRRDSGQNVTCNTTDTTVNNKIEKVDRSSSLDALSAWQRRKLYDNTRKACDTGNDSSLDAGHPEDMERANKTTTEQQQQQKQPHQTTNNNSTIHGKTRNRRALPKVPNSVLGDKMADRKKRLSEKLLETPAQHNGGLSEVESTNHGDINVQSIEESAMTPETSSSDDVKQQTIPEKDMLFQPVDPPKVNTTNSASRKAHRNAVLGDNNARLPVSESHVTDRLPKDIRLQHGVEIPKPVPKLASVTNQRNVITDSPADKYDQLSLFDIIRSCDLHHVILRSKAKSDSVHEAIKLIMSPFEHRDKNSDMSPCGKRPLLGQNGSAFVAVTQLNTPEHCVTSSLVTIDWFDRNILTEVEGDLKTGDYLIEINGKSALCISLQQAASILSDCGNYMKFVIARRKQGDYYTKLSDGEGEIGDLKAKLTALHRSRDEHARHVTELKAELQSRDNTIHGLQLDLSACKQQLVNPTENGHKPETDISTWSGDPAIKNGSKIKEEFETNRREQKLAQLKNILSHKTEVLDISSNQNVEYLDYDYDGMHVSAV